nr:protein NLRC5-like [Ciona intestinalis]|eukprot:XP_018670059.1 protein NLRC5-like [Ciona intestinalis]
MEEAIDDVFHGESGERLSTENRAHPRTTSMVSSYSVHADHVDYMAVYSCSSEGSNQTTMPHVTRDDLRHLVASNRREELRIQGIGLNQIDVPTIHPRMLKISFYDGKNVSNEDTYNPEADRVEVSHSGEVSVDDLFVPDETPLRLVAILGEAGAGKSTMSKRIANSESRICFHMEFMRMDYGEREFNLQEIIFENFYGCTPSEASAYFEWVQRNQFDCRIVIDGLDQAAWEVSSAAPALNISSKAKVGKVMANLLSGNFLPNAEILITSRSHTMRLLHIGQRPQRIVMLNGFSPEHGESLFTHFVGGDCAKWETLKREAPQLSLMCSNPAMLIYIAAACCARGDRPIRSLTSVLDVVLADIKQSEHVKNVNLSEILHNVHKVAYKAVEKQIVLISVADLKEDDLTIESVQDLTITLPLFNGNAIPTRVVDGSVKVFFNHQTLQEYFAAVHAVEALEMGNFKDFVAKRVFTENWYMVRRFLLGRLLSPTFNPHYEFFKEYLHAQQSRLKRIRFDVTSMLKPPAMVKPVVCGKKLLEEFQKCGQLITSYDEATSKEARRQFIRLLLDVRECDNCDVTKAIAERFPRDINLSRTPLTSSDAHAFSYVMQHVTKDIDDVNIKYCDLTTQQLKLIFSGFRIREKKIGSLHIDNNALETAGVRVICDILEKVERFLTMGDCFKDESASRSRYRNLNEEERIILQQALNNAGSENLILSVGGKKDIMRKS